VDSESFDDPSIPIEATLWRRIPEDWVKFDDSLKRLRPQSRAFDDSPIPPPDGSPMSVDLADEAIESGMTPEAYLAEYPGFRLVSISAKLVRSLNLGIVRAPSEDNPFHAHVQGKKTGSIKDCLAKSAEWVPIPPKD
jgi:hypothetical protein